MLPHGPRPTTMPRRSSETPRNATATTDSTVAARDRGLGEAARVGPPVAARVDSLTNEPVTTPAKAGCRAALRTGSAARRPLASITACPTCAANPSATKTTPIGKRALDSSAMVIVSGDARKPPRVAERPSRCHGPSIQRSGDRRAAGLRPGYRTAHDDRAWLDLEHETAVGAGVDDGHAAQTAHRADNGERVLAALAAGGSGRVDEPIAPAMGQPWWEDRLAVRADGGDGRAFLESNVLHPGLAQLVDDDAKRQERQQRADDAEEDQ